MAVVAGNISGRDQAATNPLNDVEEEVPRNEDESATKVRVAVRIRPMVAKEKMERCRECVSVMTTTNQIVLGRDKAFTYDYVFGSSSSQVDVYDVTLQQLIDKFFMGFNATVLAYGQTGSGKTFTMGSGNNLNVLEEDLGVIPRVVTTIFDMVDSNQSTEFLIKVSFVELHNEDINDLLDPDFSGDKSRSITIREDANGGICVLGVKDVEVRDSKAMLDLLDKGSISRSTGSTSMNTHSSRSHAIFTIMMEQKVSREGASEPEYRVSKFRFVDLAGSERVKKTKAVGERFKEGVHINVGLLALGNVISALGDERKKGSHVPYRDSKLTRMLQDSLGGNSCTMMIACVSPADSNFDETLNTLKYANRTRNIKNKAVVNRDPHSAELARLHEQIQQLQLALLRSKTIHGGPGVNIPEGMSVEAFLNEQQSIKTGEAVGQGRMAYEGSSAELQLLRSRNKELENDLRVLKLTLSEKESEVRDLSEKKFVLEAERDHMKQRLAGAVVGESAYSGEDESLDVIKAHLRTIATLKEERSKLAMELDEARDTMRTLEADVRKHRRRSGRKKKKSANKKGHPTLSPEGELRNVSDVANVDEDDDGSDETDDDQDEEREFRVNQQVLGKTLEEMSTTIDAKEELMRRLNLSRKELAAMRERYELKMKEMEEDVRQTQQQRDKLLEDMNRVDSARGSTQENKRVFTSQKAKLKTLEEQMKTMKRKQRDYEKLLRVKQQDEDRIKALKTDVDRMKAHRSQLAKKMKDEADRFKEWKEQRDKEIQKLRKEGLNMRRRNRELESENRRQQTVIQKKHDEMTAAQSKLRETEAARRRESLSRPGTAGAGGAPGGLNLELQRKKAWIEREIKKCVDAKDANERLEKELKRREAKVKQMERYIAQKALLFSKLKTKSSVAMESAADHSHDPRAEIKELENMIENLDAEIEYDNMNIEATQRQVLSLEVAPEDLQDRLAGGSAEESQAVIKSLFEALVEMKRCEKESAGRIEELSTQLAEKSAQLEGVQTRMEMAEMDYDRRVVNIQKGHEEKVLCLLSQVDGRVGLQEGAGTNTTKESRVEDMSSDEVQQLMELKDEQIVLLNEHNEEYIKENIQLETRLEELETRLKEVQQVDPSVSSPTGKGSAGGSPFSGRSGVDNFLRDETQQMDVMRSELEKLQEANDYLKQKLSAYETSTVGEDDGEDEDCGGDVEADSRETASAVLGALHPIWESMGASTEEREAENARLSKSIRVIVASAKQRLKRRKEQMEMDIEELEQTISQFGSAFGCKITPPDFDHDESHKWTLQGKFVTLKSLLQELLAAGREEIMRLLQTLSLPRDSMTELDKVVMTGGLAPKRATLMSLLSRKSELMTMRGEVDDQIRQKNLIIAEMWVALRVPVEERESFLLSNSGKGFATISAFDKMITQLESMIEEKIEDLESELRGLWSELGTSDEERGMFWSAVGALKSKDKLEALGEETNRLRKRLKSMMDILSMIRSRESLLEKMKEFEAAASDPARLRASSLQLLNEQKSRQAFTRRYNKIHHDLTEKIQQWETEEGETFMYNGMALLKELDGQVLDSKIGLLQLKLKSFKVRDSPPPEQNTPLTQEGPTLPAKGSATSSKSDGTTSAPSTRRPATARARTNYTTTASSDKPTIGSGASATRRSSSGTQQQQQHSTQSDSAPKASTRPQSARASFGSRPSPSARIVRSARTAPDNDSQTKPSGPSANPSEVKRETSPVSFGESARKKR